jgi:hypothetical protein
MVNQRGFLVLRGVKICYYRAAPKPCSVKLRVFPYWRLFLAYYFAKKWSCPPPSPTKGTVGGDGLFLSICDKGCRL